MKSLLFFLTSFIFGASCLAAEKDWVFVGRSAIGTWSIYVNRNTIREVETKVFMAEVLEDHKVQQMGIDIDDKNNKTHFYTNYKHRSSKSIEVFDCSKKMTGLLKANYYEGPMATGKLVYKYKETDPLWSKLIIEKGVFNYICK